MVYRFVHSDLHFVAFAAYVGQRLWLVSVS